MLKYAEFILEKFNTIEHLKERGVDVKKTRVIIDDEHGDVFFFLYNLSGQMVGYQKYNPKYPKTGQNKVGDPRMVKYFIWATREDKGPKIAVWGLESTKFTDEYLFVVEGVFDAARIHEAGYPAIATLCNDPNESMRSWLATIPQKKIVIYDNDENNAGLKLRSCGDYSYMVPSGKDMNDLKPEEAKVFLKKCLDEIK